MYRVNIKGRPATRDPVRRSRHVYCVPVSLRSISSIRSLSAPISLWLALLFVALIGSPEARAQAQVADSTLSLRFQLAESFMKAGQYDRAVPLLEDLYQARPDAFVFYDRLKQAYENLKQYPQAITLVDEQLSRMRIAVHLAEKGRLLFLSGREEEAREIWEEAIASRPEDTSGYRVVYQSMYQLRLIDEAIALLLRGREKLGDPTEFSSDLASLYTANGQYEAAVEEYLILVQKDERQLSYVRSRLNQLADEPEALRAAISATERAARRNPLVRPIRELMAALYLENGQYLDALNAYRALDRLGDQDGRPLFAFAQQAADAGAYDAAAEAFAEMLTRHPDSPIAPDARYSVAFMHERWGRRLIDESSEPEGMAHIDRALDAYADFMTRHPRHAFAPNARRQIAHLQWEVLGDREAATTTLRELIAQSPANPLSDEARVDLGLLAMQGGRLVEARGIFAGVVSDVDRSELVELARYNLALTHLYAGDIETALSVATAVNRNTSMDVANDAIELRVLLQENKGPDSLNTVLKSYGEVLFIEQTGDYARALEAIDSLLSANLQHPIADDARFTRARLLHSHERYDEAWQTFAEIPLLHPQSPLADRALFQAAEVLSRDLENAEEALKYYTRLLTEYPGSVLAAEARIRIRALRGDGV